ncbi:PQQ-like beta-propeller repeat protein [Stakelama sp. CBK3Z-3]|uniref:PQQ-like beta-propeller repeat protein n=1 Tax=Stakelama flava TaxID=2860338 RepID=A0ABS6XPT2_9SPHN|nr:PQQ-binding-like beta-propeller repeat protein [Stakelama flava]MBW4331411.1 PQQ-like beta-propeller repeat protein [Stakelama flava]
MTTFRTSAAILALTALCGCGIFGGDGKKATPVLGERVPVLSSESSIAADETIASVPVTVPAPVANPDWTQSGGNAAKVMGNLALGDQLNTAWTAMIAGNSSRARLAAAPIVVNGTMYVMDTDGKVHSLDAATGAERWTKSTATEAQQGSRVLFGGGVSYQDGQLYATNGMGDVVAMNAEDGAIVWRQKPGGPLRGAPTIANGNVYVISQDNQLFALSQQTGEVSWNQSGSLESQGVFGVAAPAAGRGSVVAGFSSGELNAYRYENGATLWGDTLSRTTISTSVSSLADIDADPVIDDDQVFAIGEGGRMVALDILSGRRLWEQNIAGTKTPWVAGNWIYVMSNDAKLLCIARDSGKVRWIAQLPGYRNEKKKKDPIYWSGPVMAGSRLYVVSSRGAMTSVDPQSGTVDAMRDVGDSFSLPPVVANNMLFTLSNDGRITAFR